jgi:demethylmenaquinone methyltransferase/2-methoxy-6-polyprenyl-1,4-benzoquinol methylase
MDLATGTGACAREILRRKDRGLAIVAVDSSRKMLQEGRRVWARHPSIRLVLAEMEHLPFRERSFDRIALGFGIRNSWNPGAALAEMWRVTTVGGRLVILEFSEPSGDLVRKAYRFMLRHVLPLLGGWVTGDKGSYRYLGNTITGFGSPQALQERMEANGWRRILWRRLSAGVVAVHTGERTA